MISPQKGLTELRSEQDIVMARQVVRKIVQALNFSIVDQTKMVTAASEIARNTLVHGGGGQMSYETLTDGTKNGLRLTFSDSGPGIPNIDLAMSDGWTSLKSLGMGLPGARRLVNEFDISSEVGSGTRVILARWK